MNDEKYVELCEGVYYKSVSKTLLHCSEKITLSESEVHLIDFLYKNPNQKLTAIDIFNHIHFNSPEKEFSSDSIKSLVKRLRKKTYPEIIIYHSNLGYSLNFPS